jgi:hypothetical protein
VHYICAPSAPPSRHGSAYRIQWRQFWHAAKPTNSILCCAHQTPVSVCLQHTIKLDEGSQPIVHFEMTAMRKIKNKSFEESRHYVCPEQLDRCIFQMPCHRHLRPKGTRWTQRPLSSPRYRQGSSGRRISQSPRSHTYMSFAVSTSAAKARGPPADHACGAAHLRVSANDYSAAEARLEVTHAVGHFVAPQPMLVVLAHTIWLHRLHPHH